VSGTSPLRWAIVGPGDIAERVMAPAMAAAPSAELVAVAGRHLERARGFASRHGAARTHASAEALIADPGIDAVYIATPVGSHASLAIAAALAGKDVLVEKPMALDVAEADAMVAAAASAGRRLAVCFYQRVNPRHREVRRVIAAGGIGRPTAARVNFSGRSRPRPDAWRFAVGQGGGGVFADQGSHAVDLLRYVLQDDVVDVAAFTDTLAEPTPVEDTASVLLRFARGTQAVVTAHWSIEDPSPERTSVLEVSGTDGTLITWPLHDKFSRGGLVLATATGEREIPTDEASTHVALLDAFAADAWSPEVATGDDGLAAMRVQVAAYESARLGRTVRP
jgi:predicted dehydrogenase